MVSLKDYPAAHPKILIVGPPGSGKTCLATTLGPKALVLDLNNGLTSARLMKDRWTDARLQCEVLQCWGPGGPAAMWGRVTGYINSYLTKPARPALVIDGLSDLAEASFGSVMANAGKVTDTNPKPATQAEWGVAINQMMALVCKLRSMTELVVMIGHTKTVEIDGVTKEVLGVFGNSLPKSITAAFDEMWYTKASGVGATRKYSIQSLSTSNVECKTRLQLPDGCDVNIGMEGLLEKVGFKWPVAAPAPVPAPVEAKK
jgi:hypothetical protein